ncbi:hypothetical protein Leryth_027430 [Lithospermum erythrorhizon]|uniref:Uncharacterized protein n=1 Tax=Lithospermum erythrorhizon TaxID=34254 RepID=A0AAV3Q9G1_LITER|nr:hypothetical protein Leryth_027430 [Lithospermum erythrorhizon]
METPPVSPPPAPLPPPSSHAGHRKSTLYKQKSWSPDTLRDEAWIRRQENHSRRQHRSKSVTNEDLDELKACIELGFSFDSPEMDHHLSDTFPAYGLYYSVINKQYNNESVSKQLSISSPPSSNMSEADSTSPLGSPHTIVSPGDNPQTVKARLRQWAQVVACAASQSSK